MNTILIIALVIFVVMSAWVAYELHEQRKYFKNMNDKQQSDDDYMSHTKDV